MCASKSGAVHVGLEAMMIVAEHMAEEDHTPPPFATLDVRGSSRSGSGFFLPPLSRVALSWTRVGGTELRRGGVGVVDAVDCSHGNRRQAIWNVPMTARGGGWGLGETGRASPVQMVHEVALQVSARPSGGLAGRRAALMLPRAPREGVEVGRT